MTTNRHWAYQGIWLVSNCQWTWMQHNSGEIRQMQGRRSQPRRLRVWMHWWGAMDMRLAIVRELQDEGEGEGAGEDEDWIEGGREGIREHTPAMEVAELVAQLVELELQWVDLATLQWWYLPYYWVQHFTLTSISKCLCCMCLTALLLGAGDRRIPTNFLAISSFFFFLQTVRVTNGSIVVR